jgi:hypothetical protein
MCKRPERISTTTNRHQILIALSIKRPRHSTRRRHLGYAIEPSRQWRHMHSSPQTTRSPCGSPSNMVFGQLCHHSTVLPSAPQRSRHLFTRYLGARAISCRNSCLVIFRSVFANEDILAYAKSAFTARDTLPMQRFGVAAFVAVAFVASVQAQSVYTTPALTTSAPLSAATTYTPTNVWAPNPTCSAGSSAVAQNGGYGGGVYRDDFGSYWEVLCSYDWTGTTWYDNPNGPK